MIRAAKGIVYMALAYDVFYVIFIILVLNPLNIFPSKSKPNDWYAPNVFSSSFSYANCHPTDFNCSHAKQGWFDPSFSKEKWMNRMTEHYYTIGTKNYSERDLMGRNL